MKILLPTFKPGKVSVIFNQEPPPSSALRIVEATQEQEADILTGKTYYTPEFNELGKPTGRGSLSAPPQQVPLSIANWRAKAVIELTGLTAQVEQALAAMTGPEGVVARSAWNGNADFARNGATVTTLATTLGLSDQQVDQMFIQASQLTV